MSFIGKQPQVHVIGLKPQSTIPSAPREGDKYCDDGTNKAKGVYTYINGVWVAEGAGSGSGINYIANGDASQGTTGWATYADAASARPTDGTGGSPTVTFTVNTSTPLRGAADFVLSKGAVNAQGQGASYDFTIANADKTTPCQVKINYKASNNFSFANGDVQVFVYDVTNAQVIDVIPQTLDGSGHFKGEFQSTTSTSYRLILHVATVNANVYTLQVDDVQVGPSSLAYGFLPDKQYDISSYVTGTNSFSVTRAVATPYKSRNGTWRLNFNVVGQASSAVDQSFTISGVTFKTGAIQAISTSATGSQNPSSNFANQSTGTCYCSFVSAVTVYAASGDVELDSMPTWAVDSTPVQIGDGAETRVVAAKVKLTGSMTAATPISFGSVVYDTHGMASSNSFIVPVSGMYKLGGCVQVTNTNRLTVYVDGVLTSYLGSISTAGAFISVSADLKLNVGQVVTVRPDSTSGGTDGDSNLTFSRISGPASVAASEIVFAEYTSANGQTFANSTMKFEVKVKDSHAAYNTTTGVFTAPRSGILQIMGNVTTATVSMSTTQQMEMNIVVNGVNNRAGATFGNGASHQQKVLFGYSTYVTAGSTVSALANNDVSASLEAFSQSNRICFVMP